MDPFGLACYQEGAQTASSGSDSDSGSDTSSIDSAQERALEAQARLQDFAAAPRGKPPGSALPSASDAFHEVEGPPEFLDPEATRPLATVEHTRTEAGTGAAPQASSKPFDIARLAPPLPGQKRDGEDKGPPGAVIEGKAKRYKVDEGVEATQQYSAVQIAMLGGSVPSTGDARPIKGAGPVQPPGAAAPGKVPSKPMAVSDFLSKGEGAALLPRKAQDRKDREKDKRSKGQSSVHGWKSEAEMVLRQQFDS